MEGAASSILTRDDLSRHLSGESDWAIPVMPKWARSPTLDTSDDVRNHSMISLEHALASRISDIFGTLHDRYGSEIIDEVAERNMARLERAAAELSPPRFSSDYKIQKKPVVHKMPSTAIKPATRVEPSSSVLSGSQNFTFNFNVPSTAKAETSSENCNHRPSICEGDEPDHKRRMLNDTKPEVKVHASNNNGNFDTSSISDPREEQQPVSIEEAFLKYEVPTEHNLLKFGRNIDGVEYAVRRNGEVFWYYQNEAVFDPLTQHEFEIFEAVYPAERWPYHNNYYLSQMCGSEVRYNTQFLMPIYENPWDTSDEMRAISWAEWARYHHRTAMNDEMRQAANEMAYHEGSLLWGPHWQTRLVPAGHHQRREEPSSQTQHQHREEQIGQRQDNHDMDLEAGAQAIMALIHKTPESSPSKSQLKAAEPMNESPSQPLRQSNGNVTIKTPSPRKGCLKTSTGSDSSGTSSTKSVRFADEVFLLELPQRGGRSTNDNQEEEAVNDRHLENEDGQGNSEKSATKREEDGAAKREEDGTAKPEKTGLRSPAIIYRSRTQATEDDMVIDQASVNKQQDQGPVACLEEEVRTADVNTPAKPFAANKAISTDELQPAEVTSDKQRENAPDRSCKKATSIQKRQESSTVMPKEHISTHPTGSDTPLTNAKKGSKEVTNVWAKTGQASKTGAKALEDTTKASDQSKKAWSKFTNASPMNPNAVPKDAKASPKGWKTFRKPSKAPSLNWAEETEEAAADPVPATPARTPPPVKKSPLSLLLLGGRGGRSSSETLNTDLSWTQPQPKPVLRAPVSPQAPALAPARAGKRQQDLGASTRGGAGGGQARRGRGRGSEGRREAMRGGGSRGSGEKSEGSGGGGGDARAGKREMPRWLKLRKEGSWRAQG
ncbi:hypothetical protein B0T21DRAFT_412587 [Apiosordaria backusii]|uniref:Uncharacterized protein n=1 Tax=Apiosordaria backusii TaxID=314023 RepID=A0AA40EA41_9PEZI|nr:hypothetical protein B0T21DRAFT_412587 [Apiosordaria backusii]